MSFWSLQVYGAAFSWVQPTPAGGTPRLIACSHAAAALLGLSPRECNRTDFVHALSGRGPWPGGGDGRSGLRPYAHCYGGWQFGVWAGDGGGCEVYPCWRLGREGCWRARGGPGMLWTPLAKVAAS